MPLALSEELAPLYEELQRELDSIWLEEPPDVKRLRLGILDTGAGVDNQYFTVLVMLGGEVRNLGIHALADLRALADRHEFTLDVLKIMARQMLKIGSGVIPYFGLKRYGYLLNRFINNIEGMKSKDDFKTMVDIMFLVTNRYQLWLHQTFPWYVAVHFPKVSREGLEESIRLCRETGGDVK